MSDEIHTLSKKLLELEAKLARYERIEKAARIVADNKWDYCASEWEELRAALEEKP